LRGAEPESETFMVDRFMWPPCVTQKGAGMVEVLVAIVVFSFGMLGLASLQTGALRGHLSAWARESVSTLTADLAERIRSNPVGAHAGAYLYTPVYTPAYTAAGSPQTVAAPSDCATALLPAQRALCDLHAVHQTAWRRLPGGFINVAGDTAFGMRITVMWADKEYAASGTACPPPASSTAPPATAAPSAIGPAGGVSAVAQTCCLPGAPAGIRCFNTALLP